MSLPRVSTVIRKAEVDPEMVCDWVVLDHADRHRRRLVLKGEGGTDFLLDLERAAVLEDGDALPFDDGRLVAVRAAAQRLYEVRADDSQGLAKAAWHIGNRHTPAEITGHAIYIEEDHVLGDMLRGLGCRLTQTLRPFHPERGAYDRDAAASHAHGHDHHHDHGHGHPRRHDHRHDHDHDHDH